MINDVNVVEEYLQLFSRRARRDTDLEDFFSITLKSAKKKAATLGNQERAKTLWCLETILTAQGNYLSAFEQMKGKLFYEAWQTLERIEIDLNHLSEHFQNSDSDNYGLVFIEKQVRQFQSLFPYKHFASPAFFINEMQCSICNKIVSIRNPCGHKKGEIYNGEMCVHIITKMEPHHIAIVTEPVQKYSVLFLKNEDNPEDKDHYDYSLVNYVVSGLNHPHVKWEVEWTKARHPHSLFLDLKEGDKCPCDSGKLYKDCCLKENGILQPHAQIYFQEKPLVNLPKTIYPKHT